MATRTVSRPKFMSLFRFAVIGITGVAVTGCIRYEYRRIACPVPPPIGASAVAWEASPGKKGSVAVHVATVDDRPPQAGASARVGSAPWRPLSPEGIARFDSIAPGAHELSVRAIGYTLARASVVVRADSGVFARAILARDRMVFEECFGTTQRVAKKWWQVW